MWEPAENNYGLCQEQVEDSGQSEWAFLGAGSESWSSVSAGSPGLLPGQGGRAFHEEPNASVMASVIALRWPYEALE